MSLEMELISGILGRSKSLEDIEEIITPDSFNDLQCRDTFKVIQKLHKAGKSISLVSVMNDKPSIAHFLAGLPTGEIIGIKQMAKDVAINSKKERIAELARLVGETVSYGNHKPYLKEMMELDKQVRQGEDIKLWRISELMSQPPPEYVVEGLLPVGGMSLLIGEPAAGKTFITLDMAAHIMMGKEYLTRYTTQCPIIYCCFEGAASIPLRLRAAMQQHDLTIDDMEDRFMMIKPPLGDTFNDPSKMDRLADRIKEAGFSRALLILDTFAASSPGLEENDAGKVQQAIDNMKYLSSSIGGSILYLHHKTKDGKGYRGSSALEGAADLMLEITDNKIYSNKVKDGACNFATLFELQTRHLGIMDSKGKECNSAIVSYSPCEMPVETKPIGKGARRLLKYLKEQSKENTTMVYKEVLNEYAGKTNISRTTKYAEQLEEAALIQVVTLAGVKLITL